MSSAFARSASRSAPRTIESVFCDLPESGAVGSPDRRATARRRRATTRTSIARVSLISSSAARAFSRFAARGRYSWQEETHVQFNRWLVQRYRKHWPNRALRALPSDGPASAQPRAS